MTFHTNPEENRLGTLLGKRENQPFNTYKYKHLYVQEYKLRTILKSYT